MPHFYQSAFMEALGWSLVDSFWKIGSLWIAYIIITGNGKWFSAVTRYFLAVASISAGTVWSFINIPFYYNEILSGKEVSSFGVYFKNGFVFAEQIIPWFSSLYILLVLFFSIRLLYQYYSGEKLISTHLIEADASVIHIAGRLAKQIGISKKIRVYISEYITTPLTTGFFKPMILLPVAMLNQLSIEQTESVIAHELFHIRRNDFLVNILVSVSGIVLFFNPFAKLFESIIRKERENVCDDKVVASGFDPWQYAYALYLIGKTNSTAQNSFVMAAVGHKALLLERIGRILKRSVKKKQLFSADLAKPVVLFLICIAGSLFLGRKQRPIDNNNPINNYTAFLTPVANPLATPAKETIVREETITIVTKKNAKKPVAKRSLQLTLVKADHPPKNIPVPPVAPTPEEVYNYFISATARPEEFSFEIPKPLSATDVVRDLDPSTPYIPSSTFYYSTTSDNAGKSARKVVHL